MLEEELLIIHLPLFKALNLLFEVIYFLISHPYLIFESSGLLLIWILLLLLSISLIPKRLLFGGDELFKLRRSGFRGP